MSDLAIVVLAMCLSVVFAPVIWAFALAGAMRLAR